MVSFLSVEPNQSRSNATLHVAVKMHTDINSTQLVLIDSVCHGIAPLMNVCMYSYGIYIYIMHTYTQYTKIVPLRGVDYC